jgi:hypothetical protein
MATNKLAVTSPIGTLMYVMVTGTGKENFEGDGYDYQACVDVPEKEAEDFIADLEEYLDENAPKNSTEAGVFYRTSEDDDTIKEGVVRFTFKTRTEFEDRKTGEMKQTKVNILDSDGNNVKLPEDKLIGNGSTGRVIGNAVLWERGNSKKKEHGLSLYLSKVQIKDFVPYEGEKVDAIDNGSFKGFDNDLKPEDDDTTEEESTPRRRLRRSRRR